MRTELLRAPESVASPYGERESISFSGSGTPLSYMVPAERRFSLFVERWEVLRCGILVRYQVTFKPLKDSVWIDAELEP